MVGRVVLAGRDGVAPWVVERSTYRGLEAPEAKKGECLSGPDATKIPLATVNALWGSADDFANLGWNRYLLS